MNEKSQSSEVINHLRKYKKITSLKLFGATRLSGIIYYLRNKGFGIETEIAYAKNRYGHLTKYAIYKLVKDVEI